jgi:cell division protein FtsB
VGFVEKKNIEKKKKRRDEIMRLKRIKLVYNRKLTLFVRFSVMSCMLRVLKVTVKLLNTEIQLRNKRNEENAMRKSSLKHQKKLKIQ